MSVIDFLNRKSDLLVFHGDFPGDRELLVSQTLVPTGSGGYLCTGIQKLAQRLLFILLTKKGTVLHRPNDGVTFMIDAERGGWRTPADVRQSFVSSRLDLIRQMRLVEEETDPLDEQVNDVQLITLSILPDRVGIKIKLISEAGTDYTFLTPIVVPIK